MKAALHFTVGIWLFALGLFSAQAAFTSLYVFGDGVSTTTNNTNPSVADFYYGHRFSNGRVWVEVLSQRQGLAYESDKNWSYFGHYSSDLVTSVDLFAAPSDASTALFVVWVSDADFVYDLNNIDPPYTTNRSLAAWTNAIKVSLANHHQAIQTLYAKGARTFLMPNAVDVSKVPYYEYLDPADKTFVRQRVIDFNSGFAALLEQELASLPALEIYMPDFFALLDDLTAAPTENGFVHNGIDAIDDPALSDKSLDGPGVDYLFWDYLDPTAKAHARMADVAQQFMLPVEVSRLTSVNGSNLLDLANIPVGTDGVVEASTNLSDWVTSRSFESTNVSQQVLVPGDGPRQFYRLRFPYAWSWP